LRAILLAANKRANKAERRRAAPYFPNEVEVCPIGRANIGTRHNRKNNQNNPLDRMLTTMQ
jgi:hypothetical protein